MCSLWLAYMTKELTFWRSLCVLVLLVFMALITSVWRFRGAYIFRCEHHFPHRLSISCLRHWVPPKTLTKALDQTHGIHFHHKMTLLCLRSTKQLQPPWYIWWSRDNVVSSYCHEEIRLFGNKHSWDMRHSGNNTNFKRLLKLVFTSFSTKNIMNTIEEVILNALVFAAPILQKLELRQFGNKPFN